MVTKKEDGEQLILRNCEARRGLELLSDQWTMLVVASLRWEARRFSQIHALIEGISKKMLVQTLRSLERDGLVSRVIYAEVPPRVEYSLTPLGQTLMEPILAIRDWSVKYIVEVENRRAAYDKQEPRQSLQDHVSALVQQRAERE